MRAISFRNSKDANSFGLKVSRDAKNWIKDSISGNEKPALEIFKATFMKMMDCIQPEGLLDLGFIRGLKSGAIDREVKEEGRGHEKIFHGPGSII
jgi:hypothetical protein